MQDKVEDEEMIEEKVMEEESKDKSYGSEG